MPKMITLKQAATETGMSYNWLRQMCLQGNLVHVRSGTKFLLNAEKLTEYLNTSGIDKEVSDGWVD